MKKFRIYLPVFVFLFGLGIFQANMAAAAPLTDLPSKEAIASMTKEQKEALVIQIKDRVAEIRAMDKSSMTREERKALRKELRAMHKEARAVTGVYISVGALIIIILLLIIIL